MKPSNLLPPTTNLELLGDGGALQEEASAQAGNWAEIGGEITEFGVNFGVQSC